jgi:glycosyltransferase involved in cell wall biosynthesis
LPGVEREFSAGDEVLTYVARNLEPYRGFVSFMKSLPLILARRPNAHVIIVGGDEVSYGTRLPAGKTYKQEMLKELGDSLLAGPDPDSFPRQGSLRLLKEAAEPDSPYLWKQKPK